MSDDGYKQFIGKKVFVVLKSNQIYNGIVHSITEGNVLIFDKFKHPVIFNISEISVMEGREWLKKKRIRSSKNILNNSKKKKLGWASNPARLRKWFYNPDDVLFPPNFTTTPITMIAITMTINIGIQVGICVRAVVIALVELYASE